MKIGEIVKQTKEYKRLDSLIVEIEKAIKDFDSVNTVVNNCLLATGSTTLGYSSDCCLEGFGQTTKRVNVCLGSELSKLVCDDVKSVLKKHLAELKLQRDGLEI